MITLWLATGLVAKQSQSQAVTVQADAGVFSLTGNAATLTGPKSSIRGSSRKRRRGKSWDYERAFAAREAERLESETFPIPPEPAPQPQTFDSMLQPSLAEVFQLVPRPIQGPKRLTLEQINAAAAELQAARERKRRFEEDEDDALAALLLAS